MATSSDSGLPVPPTLKRSAHRDDDEWMRSASFAVELLCRILGRSDLDRVEVLDVGCGTKITKALLDHGYPIGRYVGVDVDRATIDWLRTHVSDPRFEYHHLPARNDLYNPDAERALGEFDRLPVGDRRFDLICLFSVFTHLAPDDYTAMLRLLHHHVRDDGLLVYSLFVRGGWFRKAVEAAFASGDPELVSRAKAVLEQGPAADRPSRPRFVDEVPHRPLERASYSRDYALELVEGTGWEVVALRPPEPPYIRHYMLCRPVEAPASRDSVT